MECTSNLGGGVLETANSFREEPEDEDEDNLKNIGALKAAE